jgi:mannose/fructose/N-acetylgalactosamine-specific phosphotransferase system component IID
MNLNSINFQSIDDQYDPGFLSQYESVHNTQHAEYDKNMHELMLLHVYALLDEYDKGNHMVNPYTEKLVLETSHGAIEIPIEIQKAAITQWVSLKDKVSGNENKLTNKNNSPDMVDSLFQFLMCILIIFTLMYTLSLFRKGVVNF